MKKLIIIASIALASCKRDDCYLIDMAGNRFPFVGDYRAAWSEYQYGGQTTINGYTYKKSNNDLFKYCD